MMRGQATRALVRFGLPLTEPAVIVLDRVETLVRLAAVVLHGSHTRHAARAGSDLDLILVCMSAHDAAFCARNLDAWVAELSAPITSAYSEELPWFGRLWSFHFPDGAGRPLDIGIISVNELEGFFVEPDAKILFDRTGKVAQRRATCHRQRLQSRRSWHNAASFALYHTSVKLERALLAGHRWNALECVGIMRRVLFSIFRDLNDPSDYVHVGRPERDIEAVYPQCSGDEWARLVPAYSDEDIVRCAYHILTSALQYWDTSNESTASIVKAARARIHALAPGRASLM